MKNLIHFLLMMILCLGCKSKTSSHIQDSITVIKPSVVPNQELIKKFAPIIQGVWVKKDYIDKVIKTLSPLASADEATGITVFYINTKNINGDTIKIAAGYGNHEGGELILRFKPGSNKETLIIGDYGQGYDLGYKVEAGDTSLILYEYDNKKKISHTIQYIKAVNNQPDSEIGYGLNYLINKGTIAGKYYLIDSLNNRPMVIFTNSGKVSGLADFKTYFIENDFGDPMSNLDGICFDIYTKRQTDYAFKIKTDTLNMYDTHPNADSSELVLGVLKYQLVRKK